MRSGTATDTDEWVEARSLLDESILVRRAVAAGHADAKALLDLAGRLMTVVQLRRELDLPNAEAAREDEGRMADAAAKLLTSAARLQPALASNSASSSGEHADEAALRD